MSGPDRIWMSLPDEEGEVAVWFDPDEGGIEYVRRDRAVIADTVQDAARDVAYDAFMAECRVIYPGGHIDHTCTYKSAFWAGWAAALRAIME